MGRKKGQPKIGGRQKGAPNKSTQKLEDICEHHGVVPFEGMLLIAIDATNEVGIRLKAYTEVCKYLYPQRKAVEVSGDLSVEARQLEHVSDAELDALLNAAANGSAQ